MHNEYLSNSTNFLWIYQCNKPTQVVGGNMRKTCKSQARGQMGLHAGKPVGNAAYCFKKTISNSNWTEWSTIQGVIGRVISKSRKVDLKL